MKRILIYALQSSSASLFAYFLGQSQSYQKTLCIPDLWHHCLAPELKEVECDSIIMKVVATKTFSLDNHIASFLPSEVVLFNRDYSDVKQSLESKSYGDKDGTIDEKLSTFDSELKRARFPVVDYDSFMPIVSTSSFPISKDIMTITNADISNWALKTFEKEWGFGGINFSLL